MTDRCARARHRADRRGRHHARLRGLAAGAALVALLGVAACGGDDPGPEAGGDPPPAGAGDQTGGATGEPTSQPGDGSGTDPAEGGAASDACGLLTPADIESITGVAHAAGEPQDAMSTDWQSACTFNRADGGPGFVLVVVNNTGTGFDAHRESAGEGLSTAPEDVSGLGDAAYWIDEIDTVATHVGETFVQITAIEADRDAAVELARAALAKL